MSENAPDATPNEDAVDTAPVEEVDDALLDLDPNEAIEVGYDPDTDTDDDPENDADHPYEPQNVPGAKPVDPAMADLTLPRAEDEIDDSEGEG